MQSVCAMGHANSCPCVGVSYRVGGRNHSRTFLPPLTPAAKPSPRSRCSAPLSNALVVIFQHGYTTCGEQSTARSSLYFSASDAGVLSIAGLWDEWNDITS